MVWERNVTPELKKIVVEAEHVCKMNPLAYEMFTDAIKDHLQAVTVAVTDATSADVLQAQGRAQSLRVLYRALTEFRQRA